MKHGMLDHAGMDDMMGPTEGMGNESDQGGTLEEVKMHLKAAMRILSQMESDSHRKDDSVEY